MANRNNNKGGSGDFSPIFPGERPAQKIKGLDNGVLERFGSTDPTVGYNIGKRSNINFPGLVARGANETGFSSVTPNGVQKQNNTSDHNSDYRWGDGTSGQRWNRNKNFDGDLSGN